MGVACVAALGAAMLPIRTHISVSTAALVLVVPVVIGAAIGGFRSGIASLAAGFLVYDYFFIPPYRTLDVGSAQNWTALFVYVVVLALVTRVVANLNSTRSEAERSGDAARRLSELSELLVGNRPVESLLESIVTGVQAILDVPSVSVLVMQDDRLRVAASAGLPLSEAELRDLGLESGQPVSVRISSGDPEAVHAIALSASGRPVGLLVLRGLPKSSVDQAVLTTFANDAALALERARLQEQALRTQLLEEVDKFRQTLMGAVSHDLRTPLATIKVASSTLSSRAEYLSNEQASELYELIEVESDRLTRLVSNLLDITRIEAGVFTVHRTRTSVASLIREAVTAMETTLSEHRVVMIIPDSLPDVDVDPPLIGQVLINLLDNANRYSPADGDITVEATCRNDTVLISVTDEGPGIEEAQRDEVFHRFARLDKGGRAGLGLTIAKTFVEAHDQRIWYEDTAGRGARFVFSLPVTEEPATKEVTPWPRSS